MGLDHSAHIPAFATITDSKLNDNEYAKTLKLPRGSIVVFDRGYCDYGWHKSLNLQGVFYVTRKRSDAKCRVISRHKVNKSTGVTSDQIICFTSDRSSKKALPDVRRVGFYDQNTKTQYYFITNHFDLEAETIAEIVSSAGKLNYFLNGSSKT